MKHMKWILITTAIVSLTLLYGCESKWGTAGLGAAGGAAAAGGGYEYVINKEMNRIEDAYKAGDMSKEEYEIRKDEIQRLSLLK